MANQKNKHEFNIRRKNFRKVIGSLFQLIILIALGSVVIKSIFFTEKYDTLAIENNINEDGFIALSYFGVDRSGSTKYISKEELNKQLKILKEQGFETISQQQIIDFYEKGEPLPEKALFLSFEDGRNDSSIFSQKTLEQLNYKATMFTYADKMNSKDTKFLKPNDLNNMMDSGYWELGSNGYRLSYINIFNAEGEYFGELDEYEVSDKTTIEYYNHYLMDFLRDRYLIPKETHKEMDKRISQDYQLMNTIYKDNFSEVPKAYAIMHANSLYNNMNDLVVDVNDKNIKQNFAIHFNRELDAYNSQDDDIYNLSRLQVAPYWPVNHLLMKIKSDSNLGVSFVSGDQETANKWLITNGVAEFTGEKIILTSNPNEEVIATLNEKVPTEAKVEVDLKGNVMGQQTIYIQNDNNDYIKLLLEKNKLTVLQKSQADIEEHVLSEYVLNEIDWDNENYAFNKATNYDYWDTQQGSRIDENEYPSNLPNDRKLAFYIENNLLNIQLDSTTKFNVRLESLNLASTYQLKFGGAAISQNTSHEQYKDTIYDSFFNNLLITKEEDILYTTIPSNFKRILNSTKNTYDEIIDFFIETF